MNDDETRRWLNAADPARSLPPASAEALASLLEDTMNQPSTEAPARRGLPLIVLLGGAAAAVAGIAAGVVVGMNDDSGSEKPQATAKTTQTVTKLTASPGQGKCMPPSAEFVSKETLAFEGTVTSVEDGVVAFDPKQFFAGDATDVVTVTEPDPAMSESVTFVEGETYLVGAADGQVASCLSGPATDDLRAVYDEAFGK